MSRELFHHQWLTVLEDEGGIAFLQWSDGAACIPLNERGEVLLISEYSPAFGGNALVFPGGAVAAGEDPLEAANRELQEEVGYKAGRLDHLGTIHPITRYIHTQVHLYLARDLQPSRLPGDEQWEITIQPTPLDSFEAHIQSGRLRDSSVIAALYMARAFVQQEGRSYAP